MPQRLASGPVQEELRFQADGPGADGVIAGAQATLGRAALDDPGPSAAGATVPQLWLPRALATGISRYVALLSPGVRVVDSRVAAEFAELLHGDVEAIINVARLNDIRFLNQFFAAAHRVLPAGGILALGFETLHHRRRRIRAKYPAGLASIYYVLTFLFHRIFSKLPGLKRFYFAVTRGYGRPLSRAEVLGRLCYCGFEVVELQRSESRLHVIARKVRPPESNPHPSYGPLFRMERVGMGGRPLQIYKLRTMHPYSEYLQQYVYERNRLAEGGKIRRDFRVTVWGKWMRRLWVDELPMLVNWVKRDLKLVGVRPISRHYEALYPAEVRERRRKVRPGLIPPFYADLPRSFDEIVASEARYLDAYERHPLRTDFRYLCLALHNIVLKRARSQ